MNDLARIERKLNLIVGLLVTLHWKDQRIMTTLADIQNEVVAEKTVDEGLLALINKLISLQADPVALDALLNDLKANIAPLSAVLVANTPAAPTPVVA